MPRPVSSPALWPLIVFDAVSVGGILAIHAGLGEKIATTVVAAEVLGVTAIGVATGFYWWKTVSRDTGGAPETGELDALRRENAENLKLLQEDLHNLGQAMLKRLAHKAEARPEFEHYEALAGTMSDLAVNVAGTAADMAEAKSTIFEMQAQLDQLSDSLRHTDRDAPKHIVDDSAGLGAPAPAGALARAIAAGATGGAVARLIAGGAPRKPEPAVAESDIEPQHDGEPSAVFGGEFNADPVEASDDETRDTDRDNATGPVSNLGEFAPDWDDVDFEGGEEPAPELAAPTPEPLTAGDQEELLTDQEESDIDWLTAGIPDAEAEEEAEPMTPAASQPELLAIDDAPRKPRRPAKGDTALIAHMMIGIGNKPYLRGIGPGLSTEHGIPMDYVDVGTWQWICPEPGQPAALSIWKNDELPAAGELIELEPGEIAEIHPRFESGN